MCPELVTGMSGGHRHDEHVEVTMNTNGTLFLLIFNAALVFIFNAGQHLGVRARPPQRCRRLRCSRDHHVSKDGCMPVVGSWWPSSTSNSAHATLARS